MTPPGKRRIGRPLGTWIRSVDEEIKLTRPGTCWLEKICWRFILTRSITERKLCVDTNLICNMKHVIADPALGLRERSRDSRPVTAIMRLDTTRSYMIIWQHFRKRQTCLLMSKRIVHVGTLRCTLEGLYSGFYRHKYSRSHTFDHPWSRVGVTCVLVLTERWFFAPHFTRLTSLDVRISQDVRHLSTFTALSGIIISSWHRPASPSGGHIRRKNVIFTQ